MKGSIDATYQTLQRDMYASGKAARIGVAAFGVWTAIKHHADFNTGECWPGVRRLAELTGLSVGSVQKAIKILIAENLLRVIESGSGAKSARYVAREVLTVRVGDKVICTICVDYVPQRLRQNIDAITDALKEGKAAPEVFSMCTILPGDGFVWNGERGVLEAQIPASDIPPSIQDEEEEALHAVLSTRVKALQDKSRQRVPVDK